MGNELYLEIRQKGAMSWNQWREDNPDFIPDLRGGNLSGIDFDGFNLSRADFRETNLANVSLFETNLGGANLSGVRFHNLHIVEASLRKANLSSASITYSDLSGADLSGANLGEAELFESDLRMTKFIGANLQKASLEHADLWKSNMKKANLKDADLRYCRLVDSNLTGAILTGARLYGTARDDWTIRDVESKYVYCDEEGKHRSPRDRDLESGEFERLYETLPTIEYIFENEMSPIDPLVMDRVVQAIRERRPEFDIKIDSINARGLAPSMKFTVQHDEHKEPALEEIGKEYEGKIKQLESERDRYWEAIRHALDKPREVKLITAGPGAIVATDGSTINIQQHIHNALELQRAIAEEPGDSESFAKVAKKTALDIIGGAIKDIAKGQIKTAVKQIIELGKDLGPIVVKTASYAFFSSINV